MMPHDTRLFRFGLFVFFFSFPCCNIPCHVDQAVRAIRRSLYGVTDMMTLIRGIPRTPRRERVKDHRYDMTSVHTSLGSSDWQGRWMAAQSPCS